MSTLFLGTYTPSFQIMQGSLLIWVGLDRADIKKITHSHSFCTNFQHFS
jgi:hypothetical protein